MHIGEKWVIGQKWVIVLAAGEGSRLRSLTTDADGVVTPKQFCSFDGDATLLERTLARAEALVPRERVVVVVAANHVRWWRRQLAHLPARNVIEQPLNRGTGPGLLLPLSVILSQDAEASVLVLPSDHHVAREARLAGTLGEALSAVATGAAGVLLVGIAADAATTDYGWIVPAGNSALRRVTTFVEKPGVADAERLLTAGALWNTFILAGCGQALLELFESATPGLATALREAMLLGGDALDRLYAALREVDFSRDILQRAPERLRVLEAPPCGWTDLGTPSRVMQCLAQLALRRPASRGQQVRFVDLGFPESPLAPRQTSL